MDCTYGQTLLNIDKVNVEYNGKLVLKNVSATIKDIILTDQVKGQVVGFLGPSGVGKSTLFRIMAGLEQPTSGVVSLNGDNKPVHSGEVGVVAQNYPLFEHRTVLSNLMLAAEKKYTPKEGKDIVMGYLNDFDLSAEINHYPSQLSGGQRQRCAILQQILCSNHFLLMDEPFSGLDMINIEKTSALIRKIADLDGLNTIIIVTHDISAASAVSDHLWLMGRERDVQGRIIPGASIVETYDLIARDLAWHNEVLTDPKFLSFIGEVKDRFRTL